MGRGDDGRKRGARQAMTPMRVLIGCEYIPGLTAGGPGDRPVQWIVPPCPTLAGFRDQDLRDTAVTWLALAGSTLPEIAAVTGHSPETITSIMKHYLARHPELADHAVTKLENWHG